MGGQQVAIPPSSQGTRDTRPLRDKQYQQKCRQEIAAWLSSNGYSITSQAIASLRANDFRTIYQELVLLLDPNWPFNPEQRFEDQFVQSLRAFQYPYINQIDLRWLPTPAAMHSWPTLLGMLHWMTEMGKVCDEFLGYLLVFLQNPTRVECITFKVEMRRYRTPIRYQKNSMTWYIITRWLLLIIIRHTKSFWMVKMCIQNKKEFLKNAIVCSSLLLSPSSLNPLDSEKGRRSDR